MGTRWLYLLVLALFVGTLSGCPDKKDEDDSSEDDDSDSKKKKKKKKKKSDDDDEDEEEQDQVDEEPRKVTGCLRCRTQEDFDAVKAQGRKCCPVWACNNDSKCTAGRVCCRFESGTLCASKSRCPAGLRVDIDAPPPEDKPEEKKEDKPEEKKEDKPEEKKEDKPEEKKEEKNPKLLSPCSNTAQCGGGGLRCCLTNKKTNAGFCMKSTKCVTPN